MLSYSWDSILAYNASPRNASSQDDYFDVPFGAMLFEGKDKNKEFEGSLMDTTISAAVVEYNFPVEFFLDMLSRCVYGSMKGIDTTIYRSM